MRIGFFTDTFLPQTNGVVTSIAGLGPELVRRGHEVTVFCPKTRIRELNGMRVISYPAVRFRQYPDFMIAVPQGRDLVPDLDIVHTHSPFTMGFFGWRVSRWQKIPRVATFHTLLSEYVRYVSRIGRIVLKPISWEYTRAYYNRHRRVIAPSKTLKKVLREHGVRKPISVVPSGIDISLYKPTAKSRARKKLGIEDGEMVFLSLGRLGYEKNIDIILKAFKNVDARLIIAGSGPAEKKLKKMRDALKLKKVVFTGYIREEMKPLYFSASDAFVIASTSETQGLAAIEAMACGCPVIGADAMAISEIVKNGVNGFLFEPNRAEKLSEILNRFKPSRAMAREAVKTAKNFSIERCARLVEEVYSNL
ncbi:MAG: glycosyltransferase family 4 protein [Candidatus Hadarchaeales archaeon]